jgi:hypothetical protein
MTTAAIPRPHPLGGLAPVLIGVAVGVAVPVIVMFGQQWLILTAAAAALLAISLLRGDQADLLSPPIVFTGLWILCAWVGAQIVSVEQQPWNATVWLCVVGVVPAFWIGDFAARFLDGSVGERLSPVPMQVKPWPVGPVVLWGCVWWGLATLFTFYEFATIVGGVPLLMEGWEQARMMSGEGYLGRLIHEIAYSQMLLAIVIFVAILTQPRLFCFATMPLWALWCATVGVFMLWGSRHNLVYPAAAGVVAVHCLRWRLGPGRVAAAALLGFAFLAIVGYVRTTLAWEETDLDWAEVLADIGYSGWPPQLAQIHQTIAINFEIFRRLTETFPVYESYHLGAFTMQGIWSILPGEQLTLAEWQNIHWNTGFYGSLTATHMGAPYADFGPAGVFLWTGIFAGVMRLLHSAMRRRPSGALVVWFSFMMIALFMAPYDNLLVKLSFPIRVIILWLGMTAMGVRVLDSPWRAT